MSKQNENDSVATNINNHADSIRKSLFREHTINGFSGLIAGACGTLVGHPFDTIKVQLQVGDLRNKAKIAARNVFELYRGLIPPLCTSGIAQFIIMSMYENIKNNYLMTSSYYPISNLQATFAAATIAGGITSFLASPIQLVKVQQQSSISNITVRACVKNIINNYGWKGLFHGSITVSVIEGIGRGIYMYVYEYFKFKLSNGNKDKITTNIRIVSAAGAGCSSWLIMYPMDSIKSRRLNNFKEKSSYQCFQYIWKTGGIQGFYRGCFYAVIRSIPVAATILPLYEYIKYELS